MPCSPTSMTSDDRVAMISDSLTNLPTPRGRLVRSANNSPSYTQGTTSTICDLFTTTHPHLCVDIIVHAARLVAVAQQARAAERARAADAKPTGFGFATNSFQHCFVSERRGVPCPEMSGIASEIQKSMATSQALQRCSMVPTRIATEQELMVLRFLFLCCCSRLSSPHTVDVPSSSVHCKLRKPNRKSKYYSTCSSLFMSRLTVFVCCSCLWLWVRLFQDSSLAVDVRVRSRIMCCAAGRLCSCCARIPQKLICADEPCGASRRPRLRPRVGPPIFLACAHKIYHVYSFSIFNYAGIATRALVQSGLVNRVLLIVCSRFLD